MSLGACCRFQGIGDQCSWVSLFLNLFFGMSVPFLGLASEGVIKPRTSEMQMYSSEAVQQDGDPAGVGNLELGPSVP